MNKLETLKKKIIYRANYRGTKEMDILLSKFVDKYLKFFKIIRFNGGEGGIRTHERVAPLLVFKTSAFNRSATSP